jgi:CshA-type fibril repeat protein
MRTRALSVFFGMVASVAVVGALSFAGAGSASADPLAVVQLGQTVSVSGTPSNSVTVAAGTTMTLSLNYNCSQADCLGAVITVPLPAGLQFGSVSSSNDVQSTSSSGQTVTVTMKSPLAAGSAGQISLPVTVPNGTTLDATTFSWQSTMSASNATTSTSPSIDILSHAGNTTAVSAGLASGGAVGAPTTYTVSTCDNASATPGYGALYIANGSELSAQLPTGAVYSSSSNGGSYDASSRTVTWTLGVQGGCGNQTVTVVYPASDPSNVTGASKTVTVAWSGNDYGSPTTRALGTNSYTGLLIAPVVGASFNKWSFTTSMPLDAGGMTYFLSISNTGNQSLDTVTIDDTIPNAMQATNVGFNNVSTTPGEIWIASENGRDGIPGNADDGVLIKAADVPASTNFNFNPYATWQDTLPGLDSADFVTEVVIKMFDLPPGTGGDLASLNATPQHTGRDGTPTLVGDTITNTANFAYTSGATTDSINKSASLTIAQQIPTADARLSGPGALPFGVNQGTFALSGGVNTFDLPDPVYMLVLPAKVSYVSYTHNTSALPEPTLTKVDNWQGDGETLLRWTFPAGTVQPKNTGYQFNVLTQLATGAWGTLTANGYMSSTTVVPNCVFNFFGSGADVNDLDGDGNITETPCKWNDFISPAASTSANVTSAASGAYDSGFVTGTSYTAPGSNDMLRVALSNTGTVQLNHGVIIEVLPKPGDQSILSSATRNPSTQTFPVVLRSAPTLSLSSPTSGVTISYSVVENPCKPELSYSPSGCAPAAWSTTAPTDLGTVTAIKVDFGTNVIDPFTAWTVNIPVTTPTTGATEPDFASSNASAMIPLDDELAYNTAAFVASNITTGSPLLPSESVPLAIRVPSLAGQQGAAPSPTALTSSGSGATTQTATAIVPVLGTAHLLDAGNNPVTTLTVAGEGQYTIDPSTGVISFLPATGFVGPTTGVAFRITDAFGQTGSSTYTPTVTVPTLATPSALTSTGAGTAAETATVTVPSGGSAALLDAGGHAVTALSVTGVGDYAIDPTSGVITFTPALGFAGAAPAVGYRITDGYAQHADATYTPTVTLPAAPTAAPLTTSGLGTAAEQVTASLPAGASIRLIGGSNSTTLAVAGVGTWSVAGATMTFTPAPGFLGSTPAASYEVVDAYGQTAQSTAIATVSLPAAPTAQSATSRAVAGSRVQSARVTLPAGGSATLLDPSGNPVTSLVIPGQGTYTLAIDPSLGGNVAVLTFTADADFGGIPTPVAYRVTDAFGQSVDSTYDPGAYPLQTAALAYTGTDPLGELLVVAIIVLLGVALVLRRRWARA